MNHEEQRTERITRVFHEIVHYSTTRTFTDNLELRIFLSSSVTFTNVRLVLDMKLFGGRQESKRGDDGATATLGELVRKLVDVVDEIFHTKGPEKASDVAVGMDVLCGRMWAKHFQFRSSSPFKRRVNRLREDTKELKEANKCKHAKKMQKRWEKGVYWNY